MSWVTKSGVVDHSPVVEPVLETVIDPVLGGTDFIRLFYERSAVVSVECSG